MNRNINFEEIEKIIDQLRKSRYTLIITACILILIICALVIIPVVSKISEETGEYSNLQASSTALLNNLSLFDEADQNYSNGIQGNTATLDVSLPTGKEDTGILFANISKMAENSTISLNSINFEQLLQSSSTSRGAAADNTKYVMIPGLQVLKVEMDGTGTTDNITKFTSTLESFPRIFTITSMSESENKGGSSDSTFSINCYVYYLKN